MGIQTFSPRIFKTLGRGHSLDDSYNALELLKKSPFSNISIDLLYGLPYEDLESWKKTLEFITQNY